MRSGPTLFIVIFSSRSGRGHLLDLLPALLGGLEGSQLVFLLTNPGGGEASIILGQTGGSRGRHGYNQRTHVRSWCQCSALKATIRHKPTFLGLLLRRCCVCGAPVGPVGVGHVDQPHHRCWEAIFRNYQQHSDSGSKEASRRALNPEGSDVPPSPLCFRTKTSLTRVDESWKDGLVPLLGCLHQDPQRSFGTEHR